MKQFILFLIIAIASLCANAQKIPNKQEANLRAPAGIKVDGKATEWGDGFRAYNSATEVYYTIANDDKNLYLAIRATDALVIRKIIAGGITFSVGEGNVAKQTVAVTYPLFDRKAPPNINLRNKAAIIANAVTADSFMMAANKELISNAKKIKLSGVGTTGDTVISIYNEEGITAAGLFNNSADYTYELALPLKYLTVLSGERRVLNYTIKLNGSAYAEGAFFEQIEGGSRVSSSTIRGKDLPAIKDMQLIAAPTDMSGTYTLAP
jgi:hypothetical protein